MSRGDSATAGVASKKRRLEAGATMSEIPGKNQVVAVNPFSMVDVAEVLSARGWNAGEERGSDEARRAWCERAAFLLGPQVADRDELADLLGLVFEYDAVRVLSD